MEDEVRHRLKDDRDPPQNMADLALRIFGPKSGVELEPHPPIEPREAPDFSLPDVDPE
jgi:hypothetical protein